VTTILKTKHKRMIQINRPHTSVLDPKQILISHLIKTLVKLMWYIKVKNLNVLQKLTVQGLIGHFRIAKKSVKSLIEVQLLLQTWSLFHQQAWLPHLNKSETTHYSKKWTDMFQKPQNCTEIEQNQLMVSKLA